MAVVEVVMDSTESIYVKNCFSTAKKSIFILIILLLITTLIGTAFFYYPFTNEVQSRDIMVKRETPIESALLASQCTYNNVCLTEGCVTAAASIIDKINQSVDPCSNFYEFACGKFLHETEIPDEQVAVMSFVSVNNKVYQQLRTIFSEPLSETDIRPFTLVKQVYSSCMDLNGAESVGIQPLKQSIDKYGGWPVAIGSAWNQSNWDWSKVLGESLSDGIGSIPLFRLEVATDPRDSTSRIIDIDQPSLGLEREFLIQPLDSNIIQAYFHFMIEVAELFSVDKTTAESELKEILEFERKLANISIADEMRRNLTLLYNKYTIKEMQDAFPYVSWLDMFNSMLPNGMTINENESLIIDVPEYLTKLGDILSTTDKRTIANYFIWRMIVLSTPYLNEKLRQTKVEFESKTTGRKHQEPRWKQCVKVTTKLLPIGSGSMYVRKYFDDDTKQRSIELVNNIREEFINILQDVSWMDNDTRRAALDKAKALENHISYPDELLDDKKLIEHYENIQINAESLFINVVNVRKFERNFDFKLLREPVNKTDWRMHSLPSMVNAQYSPLENSIQIPAAILQGVFFSPDRPRYMNYGAIGQIIGHEITHGFDDQGRQFDKNGNLLEWWKSDTKELFLEKSKCIIDQYGNYEDSRTGLKLNGINTQGENIADNGGLKEAYSAYKRWASNNPVEPYLPGLKYNPQQLFWISAAQTWCAVTRKEYNTLLITTDVHSPNEFRVIGTLSNSHEFATDFNCPIGSTMNPEKKCEVW